MKGEINAAANFQAEDSESKNTTDFDCLANPLRSSNAKLENSVKAKDKKNEAPFSSRRGSSHVLEPVHNLLRSKAVKARTTICRLVLSLRSQFFHNRLHFSSQAKERSTTHLFGNTTKVCNSLRFITSTVAPIVVFI